MGPRSNPEPATNRNPSDPGLARLLKGFSIEVMPRTAEKIPDFRAILPAGTLVYVAHIEGTPIRDMVRTARRIRSEGFSVMPHFPARVIPDRPTLKDWISRYQDEAGVDSALLLAGGVSAPIGDFRDSMQLLETGLFGAAGFSRLHVAGHPEGNRDIESDGSSDQADAALLWKQRFSESSDAAMAIVTQFCFDAEPVVRWSRRIQEMGVSLPVHVGVAGPARLQTLIRFALSCGVGNSLRILQRRARDVTRLMKPFEPDSFLKGIDRLQATEPAGNIVGVHFFPLGGIATCSRWILENGGDAVQPEPTHSSRRSAP